MAKSFKKVIACLLAVIMVAFSVPFTAMATEVTPNVTLHFSTVHGTTSGLTSWKDQTLANATSINNIVKQSGLYDIPLQWDGKHTLKLTEAAKTQRMQSAAKAQQFKRGSYDPSILSGDTVYGTGDVIFVTVAVENVDTIAAFFTNLTYNNAAIQPAGVVTYSYYDWDKEEDVEVTTFMTEAELAAVQAQYEAEDAWNSADWNATLTPGACIEALSAYGIYGNTSDNTGLNIDAGSGAVSDAASWATSTNIQSNVVGSWATGTDETDLANDIVATGLCADDGTYQGYTFANSGKAYMSTFMFKIVDGSKDFDFAIAYPDEADKTYVAPSKANGGSLMQNVYTYAPYVYNGTQTERSTKVTFLGKNEYTSTPSTDVTYKFVDEDGQSVADDQVISDGSAPVVPSVADVVSANSLATYDADNHWSYAWADPTTEGDTVTYVLTKTDVAEHSYSSEVTTPATHTTAGVTTYTCTCGKSYTDDKTPAASGHTWGEPVFDWDNMANGKVTVTRTCTANDGGSESVDADVTSDIKTAQSCTADEITTYTATAFGVTDSTDVKTADATGHTYGEPTWSWTGYTAAKATFTCVNGDDSQEVNATITDEVTTPETATTAGVRTYTATVTFKDKEYKDTKDDVIPAAGYTYKFSKFEWAADFLTAEVIYEANEDSSVKISKGVVNATVDDTTYPATCTADGKIVYTVDYEGNQDSKETTVKASGHAYGEPVWSWNGVTSATATFTCANDASHVEEVNANVAETENTVNGKAGGTITYTATANFGENTYTDKTTVTVDPANVTITVPAFDMGNVTGTVTTDGYNEATADVVYGSTYTLTATAAQGATFEGWQVNNKIVSKDATFTSTAYANMTITPVFEETAATNNFTVIFYDMYGNLVKKFTDVAAGTDLSNVTAPSFPAAVFKGWNQDVSNIQASMTVWAEYDDVETPTAYTVNLLGVDASQVTMDIAGGYVNGSIPYDTKVTVTYNGEGAGWAIVPDATNEDNYSVVSTTESYTFYVGSNVTLKLIANPANTPSTTVIGGNRVKDANGELTYRYNIVATRNVPAGYTLVDYGFVYGKNLSTAQLDLDNEGKTFAGTGAVKVVRGVNNSSANEFALNYGIKNMDATIGVKSFITVKSASGVEVIYSDYTTFGY